MAAPTRRRTRKPAGGSVRAAGSARGRRSTTAGGVRSGTVKAAGSLAVALVVLVVLGFGAYAWLRDQHVTAPEPGPERCVATSAEASTAVTLSQAHYASIITGVAVRRGLPARAASIALTTAYQETGIRNLSYGDRDSVGLFQQRPSQGWGTKAQLQDPYYATGRFYDALVKVKGWRTGSINDVAQKVQRSGFPDAYRDHESDGRTLASTLSGERPGGFTCLERRGTAGRPAELVAELKKTFGTVAATRQGRVVTVRARTSALAWAYAGYAVANSGGVGLVRADVAGRTWTTDAVTLPGWTGAAAGRTTGDPVVTLTLR